MFALFRAEVASKQQGPRYSLYDKAQRNMYHYETTRFTCSSTSPLEQYSLFLTPIHLSYPLLTVPQPRLQPDNQNPSYPTHYPTQFG